MPAAYPVWHQRGTPVLNERSAVKGLIGDDGTLRAARPPCPACGTTLVHVTTEISSGAFRTQAAPAVDAQTRLHFTDARRAPPVELGQRLLPDPIVSC